MKDFGMLSLQSPASIRMRVTRMAMEACSDAACLIQAELLTCVDAAVRARQNSEIKAYVTLLAWRDVEACIRVGHCPPQPEVTTS